MKTWITLISLISTCCTKAQVLHNLFSTYYNSVVACSNAGTDASSFLINPAALAALRHASAAFYSEQKFLLKELSGGSASFALPGAGGGLGAALGVTGAANYSNAQAALAYGKALGKQISLGVQINYHLLHIAGYGNSAATSFNLGCIIHATDKLFTGVAVSNPVGGKFTASADDKLPAIYTLLMGWEPSENLVLCMLTKKTENLPVDVLFSLQYSFVSQFFVRAGTTTASPNFFAGVGLHWKGIRVDLVGNYHFQLGATPAIQLIIQPQNGGQ
ncbi:MAG: hypothetical protein INR73_05515 [Williamsia sp.]|nr:hypothetical protein [Williamsia sp.]